MSGVESSSSNNNNNNNNNNDDSVGGNSRRERSSGFMFTGVNQAGAEFTPQTLPGELGRQYIWPAKESITTLVEAGFNTIRVPFLLERMAPKKLNGPLDEAYAAGLCETVTHITGLGAFAVLDAHNYGRYRDKVIKDKKDLASFWGCLASRYRDNPRVVFDVNNEFYDMKNELVYKLNQASIDAIRAAGATSQYIFVEGNMWSGAWHWISSGTAKHMVHLTDPSDKIIYEMHQYLDGDGSGKSGRCVSSKVGSERLAEATAWLRRHGKRGILGETAVSGAVGSDDVRLNVAAVRDMLGFMQRNCDVWTGWLWWAAGPWWHDHMFSMEPPSGPAYVNILPHLKEYM